MIRFITKLKPGAATKKLTERALEALLQKTSLGFLQLPNRDDNWSKSEKLAKLLATRSDRLVVLGMGGSALGGRCLTSTLGRRQNVQFLYNTDPSSFESILGDRKHLRESQFLLISKSGNTLELDCMIDILQTRLKMGGREIRNATAVITEPKPNPLRQWADKNNILVEDHPLDVGGRFSVLTPVGLVPAAFAGVALSDLRRGAEKALASPALALDLATFYYESFKRKEHISVFWLYADLLNDFGPWLVQLWAESLGKKTKGPSASTPTTLSGTCDQHSALQQLMGDNLKRSICFLRSLEHENMGPALGGDGLEGFAYLKGQNLGHIFSTQALSTEEALRKTGRSTSFIELEKVDALAMGELLFSFELVIGILGELLKINAFDQPGVELGKKITKKKLEN